jgi:hypothetical protein
MMVELTAASVKLPLSAEISRIAASSTPIDLLNSVKVY